MSHIRVLSEQTINQIAAGEVIENPASVVKELIENSLDAGASKIVIEIKGGGFQMIRISDDGSGMDKDDALLCFERHATSKIKEVEDLSRLSTMGFRGEALASIAAITQLTLVTAQKEGTKVEVEGGRIVHAGPYSRAQGTTVEVRALFYNVPARKKFQKTAQASNAEIHRLVMTLSLAHPEVSFELHSNETVVFSATGYPGMKFSEQLKLRIQEALGDSFAAVPIDFEGVLGYVGSPQETRPNRSGQFIFINRRAVASPMISFTVRDGFGTRIDAGRHPIFILHLDLDAHLVDVNVHPQKREVRFQDEAGLRRKILNAISSGFGEKKSVPFEPAPVSFNAFESTLVFREEAPTAPILFEADPLPIGLYRNYLLLDAASVDGYGEGVIAVDLLAVQERIALEALQSKETSLAVQRLLLPLKLEFSSGEAAAVASHAQLLENLGISLTPIGKNAFSVDAIPAFLAEEDVSDAVLLSVHAEDAPKALARFARRQKKVFVLQEALALWKKGKALRALPSQPLMVYLSHDAVAKLFAP
jgi:DNA mismatch repair protein MutL